MLLMMMILQVCVSNWLRHECGSAWARRLAGDVVSWIVINFKYLIDTRI